MTFKRFWRHAVTDHRASRRAFSVEAQQRIEAAIARGETTHAGQVRFCVEHALPLIDVIRGKTPRARALEVFASLRIWDTEHNCGVLVYLLLADKDVEIVADRGIDARVADSTWQRICGDMERAFRAGDFARGVESGIEEISALLTENFPHRADGSNELTDAAVVS